jgi:hypothetical protein
MAGPSSSVPRQRGDGCLIQNGDAVTVEPLVAGRFAPNRWFFGWLRLVGGGRVAGGGKNPGGTVTR